MHTYLSEGIYTVKLRVRLLLDDCDQSDSLTKPAYVVVRDLDARFAAAPTAGVEPLTVQFTDSSDGNPASWNWSFGDGAASTVQHPSHVYNQPGLYDVKLRIANALFTDSTLKSSYIRVDTSYSDVATTLWQNQARPGFSFPIYASWTNLGTRSAEYCSLKVQLPAQVILQSVDTTGVIAGNYTGYTVVADTFVFPLDAVAPTGYYGGIVRFQCYVPVEVPIGTVLVTRAWLSTSTVEANHVNDDALLEVAVVGSWDPNDKSATPAGVGLQKVIGVQDRLNYLVEFENKAQATAEAIYVRVVDTLDPDFDWGSLVMGEMSHPSKCTWTFDAFKGIIEWFCDSIMLSPNIVPPQGEGYFSYSISPKADLPGGTELTNRAHIRFDFNPWLAAPEDGPVVRTVQTPSCCAGTTGNVNMFGIVDLSDLSSLVSYLTGGGYVLSCPEEANVNAVGIVDLADLSALVSYLTGGGYVLPNCPQ
ncbi:hypothetical protein C3F09_12570 [candidate division GN15 bacterium]|uniref:PKD domain-containing protein n=1 Tax=candidate division GN15 bacterium TaxID=2072418 RepID=A0A855WTR3_9BACT|nr:MAG: hypothetical protein C3F09_12570 [candidate division GN15 bacterium]